MPSFAFVLLFLIHLPCFRQPSIYVAGDADLIQRTCQNTNHYNVCVTSLESDPTSIKADAPGLAAIIVNVAIAETVNASSYISRLLKKATDKSLQRILSLCGSMYSNASTALQGSIQELGSESYDYASIHVSAAMVYLGTCRDIFKLERRLVYPSELRCREQSIEQLCDVALGIIDTLI